MKTNNRNITISTIIPRGDKLNNKANEVNNSLIQLCRDCNVPFIDHSKNIIIHKHLNRSKLHFNITGNRIFVDNIKAFPNKILWTCWPRFKYKWLIKQLFCVNWIQWKCDPNYGIRKNDSFPESVASLEKLRLENLNRLIFVHLNINSIRNKFEMLPNIIQGKLDILLVSETKVDISFPSGQFIIRPTPSVW